MPLSALLPKVVRSDHRLSAAIRWERDPLKQSEPRCGIDWSRTLPEVGTSVLGLSIGGLFAAIALGVLNALVEDGLRHYVRRRWPRFAQWWTSRGGLYARHIVLFLFFTAAAVFFGLATAGMVGGAEPDPVGLALTLPAAAMSVWSLVNLARLRASGASRRGYRRSSDGSWSAS